MLKTYVKYLLVIVCLPYVYSAQASEGRETVLFQGQPGRPGMNPFRRENLRQQPSFLKTYSLPAFTSGLASLAGAGFALQDTHQWAPYVGLGSGALAISLLAKKLWNLRDPDNAKSVYTPLAVGSIGGFFVGRLLGKLLQNRELNPYSLAAIAGAGALCGIGAQYAMPHVIQPEQEPSGKNIQNVHEQIQQPIINFITAMFEGQGLTMQQDDSPEKVKEWRHKALKDLKSDLTNRQIELLQKAYHRRQIADILRNSSTVSTHLNALDPEFLREWIMWASDYYKTVPGDEWLAMVKEDLSKKENWFKRKSNDFTDVFNFIMQLQNAQRLNEILDEVSNEGYNPLLFLQKMRNFKEGLEL